MATKTPSAPLVPKGANGEEFESTEDLLAFIEEEKKREGYNNNKSDESQKVS